MAAVVRGGCLFGIEGLEVRVEAALVRRLPRVIVVGLPASELLELGEQSGLVQRMGSWYSLGDLKLGQGKERAREALLTESGPSSQLRESLNELAN